MSSTPPKPALFLDRDGVINIDDGYINNISKIIFNDEIFEISRYFKQKGYKLIIVTNQSGIGRGLISTDQYNRINSFILEKFNDESCPIDLILTASINPEDLNASLEEKSLRKPNPGMILRAKSALDLDLSNSLLIGDNLSDMQAGESAGVSKLYLINNPPVSSEHFESYINLKECLVRLRNVFNV
jgi:D-glycero-D-manno-heptose 1,7-bisphosphate phosphatase